MPGRVWVIETAITCKGLTKDQMVEQVELQSYCSTDVSEVLHEVMYRGGMPRDASRLAFFDKWPVRIIKARNRHNSKGVWGAQ
jgi:hypothetical protein